jgi:hypothetical protein
MGTDFNNLRATAGTVNFQAIWRANDDTIYTVKEYLQELDGNYPSNPNNTWT